MSDRVMDESQHVFVFVSQVSTQPLFVPGVWGPYLSAMLPELWLNEGGQSATGRLVRAERFRIMNQNQHHYETHHQTANELHVQ